MKFVWYFIGLLPLLLVLGCKNAPIISWDLKQTSAFELSICQGRVCPELTVAYPNFYVEDSALHKRLNTLRDSLIIQALYLGSDRPNFDLSIAQGMNQYLWVGLDYKTELQPDDSYNGLIQVEAFRQNDTLLVLELSSRLILPEGLKIDRTKRTIDLNK